MQKIKFEEIIEEQLNRFEQQVELPFIKDLEQHMSFVRDGIVNLKKYLDASVKILWILKEANSPDNSIGYDMRPCLATLHSEKNPNNIHPDWRYTWTRVAYTTYGIFEKKNRTNIPNISGNAQEVLKYMPNIAHINIKKFAGNSKTNDKEIRVFFDQYRSLLYEQIEIINPDVIIFGGTFKYFSDYFKNKEKIYEWPPVYQSNNKLLIDTCHPNGIRGFRMTDQQYCDHIINTVIKWMEKL